MKKIHSITLLGIAGFISNGNLLAEEETRKSSEWSYSKSASVGYSYDDNVFLQDVGSQASLDSSITKIGLKLGSSYDSGSDFKLSTSYSGSFNSYSSERTEDHSTHVGIINASGKANNSPWKTSNKFVLINGSDIGPTFTGPGGATAAGGIAIRNRRDALIYIGSGSVEFSDGNWYAKPVFDIYSHDFGTIHQSSAGYLNYVDRNDLSGGVDIGSKKLWEDHNVYLSYRYGHQKQERLLNSPIQYSNYYRRALIGFSGKPKGWLKYDFIGGPDYRSFGSDVASGFDPNPTHFYYKTSVSFMPTENDSINFSSKQYVQPSYGGRSIYQDTVYSINWKHTKDDLSYSTEYRAYNADWPAPFGRNDWIYTLGGTVTYKIDENWKAEASYSYDWSKSNVPNTSGREFTRNLINIGFNYSFE